MRYPPHFQVREPGRSMMGGLESERVSLIFYRRTGKHGEESDRTRESVVNGYPGPRGP